MSKIAPHEGNELDMLLAGTKKFAVLEKWKHHGQVQRLANLQYSTGIKWEIDYKRNEVLVWVGDGHYTALEYKLLLVNRDLFSKQEFQYKMGKIFGYSDEEIEGFINNPPDCNCTKCGGNQP